MLNVIKIQKKMYHTYRFNYIFGFFFLLFLSYLIKIVSCSFFVIFFVSLKKNLLFAQKEQHRIKPEAGSIYLHKSQSQSDDCQMHCYFFGKILKVSNTHQDQTEVNISYIQIPFPF